MLQYSGTLVYLGFFFIKRVQKWFLNSSTFLLNIVSIDHPQLDHLPVMHKLGLKPLIDRQVEANLPLRTIFIKYEGIRQYLLVLSLAVMSF